MSSPGQPRRVRHRCLRRQTYSSSSKAGEALEGRFQRPERGVGFSGCALHSAREPEGVRNLDDEAQAGELLTRPQARSFTVGSAADAGPVVRGRVGAFNCSPMPNSEKDALREVAKGKF
ncbi:hypothetical protein [Rhodococcus sp. ABRD24]|uniref:hypothetical protein n=1 Tax=Rhodococcus sp. ABRD24 TaxID=2507582 RepID=UPI001A95500D|nr:hypothetical protein [Rhodococcus sp. ABRD24]